MANITKNNFIVVYVLGNDDSREFAEYYANIYSIDTDSDPSSDSGSIGDIDWQVDGQLLGIECDTDEILDNEDAFNLNILNPIKDALENSSLSQRTIYGIVLGYSVPGGFKDYVDQEYSDEINIISSTSRISRLYHNFEKQIENKLYDRKEFKRFDSDDADFCLICSRIDAPTLLLAKEYVDNAEKLKRQYYVGGKIYVDPYSNDNGTEATIYQNKIKEIVTNICPKVNLDYFTTSFINLNTDVIIPYIEDDSFVWSWTYSKLSSDFFQYSAFPRVFFYNADNTSGYTIRDPNSNSFPLLSMNNGYVSCAASMSDPEIDGFLNPISFFDALYSGATIGEAYLFSLPYLDWTITLFGDPLQVVSFPLELDEEDLKITDDQMWYKISKNVARTIAQLYKKEQSALAIRDDIVNSNIYEFELSLLNLSNGLYESNSYIAIKSKISRLISSLYSFPVKKYRFNPLSDILTLDDFLEEKEYKISSLFTEFSNVSISDANLFDEGWWEFEYAVQDDYSGYINYHFELEVYDNEEMTSLVFSSDSSGLSGWYYESEKEVFTTFPVNGISSSYIGRKVKYQSRYDSTISLDEYLTRGETYYFRIRQYDSYSLTEFSWRNYSDIIYT